MRKRYNYKCKLCGNDIKSYGAKLRFNCEFCSVKCFNKAKGFNMNIGKGEKKITAMLHVIDYSRHKPEDKYYYLEELPKMEILRVKITKAEYFDYLKKLGGQNATNNI